jgi:GTPase
MAMGEREYLLGPDAYGRWTPVTVLSIKHKESLVTRAEAGQSATFCLEVRDAKAKLRRGMVLLEQRLPNGPSDETQSGVQERLPNAPPSAVPFFASVPPPFLAAPPGKLPGSFPAGVLPGAAVVWCGVVWELEVSVHALRLPSPVPVGTEIVLHCVGVKQAARLLRVDDAAGTGSLDKLRDGADARLRLRFVHTAEFLQIGMPCILRDASAGASHLGLAIGLVTAASP